MNKRKLRMMIALPLLVGVGLVSAGFLQTKNAAAYLTGFSAGNIMSDYVMGNKNAMSEAQIQSFLKSKNPCNDNDRSKYDRYTAAGYSYTWRDGHFVCLADETFGSNGMPTAGGKSAARIIWEAAQEFSINPQVLIVLLQKEQGLITDTWPNHRQYQTATGFGCPDTAPCDSQYYGLNNQIRLAAKLFRDVLNGGWSNYPAYSTVYVRYSPDASCGGSNVYIENRATSALYRYTPYQPNAAALAAGTGTAPCGAYGNRNFYNFFTDWFGSAHDIGRGPFTNKLTSLGSGTIAIGSYTTDWEKVQHVISLKSDGGIYETYWGNGNKLTTGNVSLVEDAMLINGYSNEGKYQQIISLKNNGDIFETWWW